MTTRAVGDLGDDDVDLESSYIVKINKNLVFKVDPITASSLIRFKEIIGTKPSFQGKHFHITWFDPEGDTIDIFDDNDLQVAFEMRTGPLYKFRCVILESDEDSEDETDLRRRTGKGKSASKTTEKTGTCCDCCCPWRRRRNQ